MARAENERRLRSRASARARISALSRASSRRARLLRGDRGEARGSVRSCDRGLSSSRSVGESSPKRSKLVSDRGAGRGTIIGWGITELLSRDALGRQTLAYGWKRASDRLRDLGLGHLVDVVVDGDALRLDVEATEQPAHDA